MNKGWECPVCGKGVAPWQSECDHSGDTMTVPTVWPRYDPFRQPHYTGDPLPQPTATVWHSEDGMTAGINVGGHQ